MPIGLTHTITTSVRSNAGTVTSTSYEIDGDAETNIEKTFAIGTNVVQDFTADVSTIVSLAIKSTTAMTLKTNSSGSPADTITLLANKPLIWNTQIQSTLGTACPLTIDVTGLFVTNAAAGDLTLYCLTSGS